MNRKPYYLLATGLSLFLLYLMVYGLFYASNPKEIPSAQIGKKAEPFRTETFGGQPLSLEEMKGRPVVLNFWASWCVSCRREAHILERSHKKYTPKGAAFIGIAINDTRAASLRFIRRYGKTYLLAPDDPTGNISLDYGVTAVPETFFIDRRGIIKSKVLGAVSQKEIEDFLNRELSEKENVN